jgi:histidinol-phosphate aminotransferase
VYPWPSFVIYKLVSIQCDIEGRPVACLDHRLDLKALAQAIDDKTKIVFICNPNNPTSTYVGIDEFAAFLEAVPEKTLVVVDEAYYEYVTAGDFPQTIELRQKHPALVTLRTFSKVHALAGLRIGYAVADKQIVQVLHKTRQPFNVNRLAHTAALAALDCRDKIQPSIDQVIRERELLRNTIIDAGWDCPPSQTNFLYVIPTNYPGDAAEPFLERGIIIRNMAPFGAKGNIFRLTVGTPEENKRFISALDEILARSS